MKKLLFIFTLSCLMFGSTYAQVEVVDGAYKRENYKEKKPVPLSFIREADAIFAWTIIRVVDLKQKQNLPLTYPKSRLIDILLEALKSGEVDDYLFNLEDLEPENRITSDDVLKELNKIDTVTIIDLESGLPITKYEPRVFNPNDVIKFRIKEEWVFDKQRSTMLVRIVAIAPITKLRSSDGTEVGEIPMFWVYYPAIRETLSATQMFNWKNSGAKLSFDDYFIKRLFSSYIFKSDDVMDRRIQDYATGRAALIEAERIKHQLIDFEQSLWEY